MNNSFAVEIMLKSINDLLDYLEDYINGDINIDEFKEHYSSYFKPKFESYMCEEISRYIFESCGRKVYIDHIGLNERNKNE